MADGGDVSTAAPGTSASVRIWAQSPKGEYQQKTVRIDSGSNWRALLTAADHLAFPVGDSPIIYSEEAIYERNGEERRAIRCFDEQQNKYLHIDYQDGSEVNRSSILRWSYRFLHPTVPLPSARLPPLIFIRPESDVVTADPQGQLRAAPGNGLWDRSFVAAVWGVRSGSDMFWKLWSWRFVSAESGRDFHIGEIPGDPKRFVCALLQDKDPVPRVKVPEGEWLEVWRRENVKVKVKGNCVRCVELPVQDDGGLWTETSSDFDINFAAAARRK